MEEYKRILIRDIWTNDDTIEQLERTIRRNVNFTVNRNEEGKLHSRYLGDRYEPAIIYKSAYEEHHYYLFDGDLKDCEHPFCVVYSVGNIYSVTYYSSERIKNGEPILISTFHTSYNKYNGKKLLDGYPSKRVETGGLSGFSLLCDEFERKFNFAD